MKYRFCSNVIILFNFCQNFLESFVKINSFNTQNLKFHWRSLEITIFSYNTCGHFMLKKLTGNFFSMVLHFNIIKMKFENH